jgi:hypothetical protein
MSEPPPDHLFLNIQSCGTAQRLTWLPSDVTKVDINSKANRPRHKRRKKDTNLKKCLHTYTVLYVEQRALNKRQRAFVVRATRARIKGQ